MKVLGLLAAGAALRAAPSSRPRSPHGPSRPARAPRDRPPRRERLPAGAHAGLVLEATERRFHRAHLVSTATACWSRAPQRHRHPTAAAKTFMAPHALLLRL